ncbi:MAG TPA: anti-sigma factor [Streptosporangiaceae bacterium]
MARGDHAAFAEVYDRVAAPVFGTVRSVVRDRSLSEEVTQEVFVEVWRAASRFDACKGSPMAWVATIAHRRTGGTATVMMSRQDRMLVFAATGLRALPGAQCYELWLMRPGADRPAGLLPMPKHGMSGPVVTTGLEAGDRLGLTVEPAHGSRRPTTPMILVLAL